MPASWQETLDCVLTFHCVRYHSTIMTMNIAHKGLRRLHERHEARGPPANLVNRIERILDDLACASGPRDMNRPTYRLHPLKGEPRSIFIRGVCFPWIDDVPCDVEIVDHLLGELGHEGAERDEAGASW